MIEFSGVVSRKVQGKLMKQSDRELAWCFLAVTIIAVIATIFYSIDKRSVYWEFLVPTIIIALFTILFFIAPQTSYMFRFHATWQYTVRIENGMITKIQPNKKEIIEKETNKVKKVIDYGEYYTVTFRGISKAIFCQKNLLVSGTLEEFEALFEGKIKRKKTNR